MTGWEADRCLPGSATMGTHDTQYKALPAANLTPILSYICKENRQSKSLNDQQSDECLDMRILVKAFYAASRSSLISFVSSCAAVNYRHQAGGWLSTRAVARLISAGGIAYLCELPRKISGEHVV